jgi:iron complex outermembrane receptor protein
MTFLAPAVLAAAILAASDAPPASSDLSELTLEQLTQVEVTSVTRTQEPLADAAAAITVVTGEELRRSGATSIPEALRWVPGLHVGRVSSSAWEVGARGFSSVQSNKLLVLSDTRSIYTPLFSGVFWDVQDFLLADVDRIEVIRGPGATLWGANAMNGVINITTKSAQDTQGLYLEAGGGSVERDFGALRYGGRAGHDVYFRVFAKYFDRRGGDNPPGLYPAGPNADAWWMGHAGFRADWQASTRDSVTFQGDAYRGEVGLVKPSVTIIGRPGPSGKLVTGVAGGNLLARWTHRFSDRSGLQLRVYYDRTHRDDPSFVDDLDTLDLDLQHHLAVPGWRQDLVWGLAYRLTANRNAGKVLFALSPEDATDHLVSGFLQDRIRLLASLELTVGTKLEYNTSSGFELQPSARLAWQPGGRQTLWASVARAVRVPTRLERDVEIVLSDPTQPPVAVLRGNQDFGSEQLIAYELGYRWQVSAAVSLDAAGFYNRYTGLASLELGTPTTDASGNPILPVLNQNLTDGRSRGGELSVTVQPWKRWRLVGTYAYLFLTLDPHGMDLNRGSLLTGATPRNQVGLQSSVDLPRQWELDLMFRYADAVKSAVEAEPGEETPAYATLDAQVAWHGWSVADLSLVGQSLLQRSHREFPGGTEVPRSFYLKLSGHF